MRQWRGLLCAAGVLGLALSSGGIGSVGIGAAHAAQPAVRAAHLHRPIVALQTNQSTNWSGYNQGALEKNTTFHGIAGDWVVPTASEHKAGEAEFSSTWIGIGGGCVDAGCAVTDSTLIQTGTEQDAGPTGGPAYSAWWEIIPAPSVGLDPSTNPVAPGDHMHAAITQTAPQVWNIVLDDVTKGWKFQQTVPYSSSYATAEWITETPVVISNSGSVQVGPLPKLSTVTMDLGQTTSSPGGTLAGAQLVPSEELQLVDPNTNQALATPSAPDADADGFNDCAYATSCPAPSATTTTSGGGGSPHHRRSQRA